MKIAGPFETIVKITLLEERDLSGALRLSTAAEWNQTDDDWRRLLTLWPGTCFVLREGDQVIATATLSDYGGAVAWVGMVLVDERHRGRGIGGAMLQHVLAIADARGVRHVGLDATDMGRPVYAKQGFVEQVTIERWSGPTASLAEAADPTAPLSDADWPDLLGLDAEAVGVDRSSLLRHLAGEAGSAARVLRRGNAFAGFGFARAGRAAGHVGPVVARSPADAGALTASLVRDLAGAGSPRAVVDVVRPEADAFRDALAACGFAVARRLTRMSRPPRAKPLLAGPLVYAATSLELG